MKVLKMFLVAVIAIITGVLCVAGMGTCFDELSKPQLPWFGFASLVIGICFLGYFMLLVYYLAGTYIVNKLTSR